MSCNGVVLNSAPRDLPRFCCSIGVRSSDWYIKFFFDESTRYSIDKALTSVSEYSLPVTRESRVDQLENDGHRAVPTE